MPAIDEHTVEYIFSMLDELVQLAVRVREIEISSAIAAVIKEHAERRDRALTALESASDKTTGRKLN